MRHRSSNQIRQSGDVVGIVVSTAFHAIILVTLSLLFLRADPPVARIQTDGSFADELPPAVATMLPEIDPIEPEESAPVIAVDAGTQAEFLPQVSEAVSAKLVADSDMSDAANANSSKPLAGVAAAVADIQDRVSRAGGKSGEVQFSLSWKDFNDLDLHVIVPDGTRIYFGHRKSPSKGELDVDMNVRPESREPVENVRWLKGKARSGRYTIIVHWFRPHAPKRQLPFDLVAKLGEKTELVKGAIRRPGHLKVFRFRYIRPTVSAARRVVLDQKYRQLQIDEEKKAGELLAIAKSPRDLQKIAFVAVKYPHTDAGLEAMQLLPGKPVK